MFPDRYFPPRYYPNRYFGEGGGAGPGPGPSGFATVLYKRHRIRLGQWYGSHRWYHVILLCVPGLLRIFG